MLRLFKQSTERGKEDMNEADPDHYSNLPMEPWDFIQQNKLDFFEGNVVKYITRHRRKGEGARDIEKVIHYCELILEKDYGRE